MEDIDPRIVIPETGRAKRRLAAVLVLDVVGYSRHLAVDPDATLASMRSAYRSIVRPVVRAYAGRVVKLMGDGVLAEFPDAGGGLAAALDIQQALAAPVDPALRRRPLDLRAGLHLGEVLSQDGDIFGETVNIAVRLQASAKPGGVLMSWAVYERLNPPIAGRLVELGPLRLRHVDRPIHVVAAEIGPG